MSLLYMYMFECDMAIFSFEPPSHVLVAYHHENGGMPIHDGVGVNSEKMATNDIYSKCSVAMW